MATFEDLVFHIHPTPGFGGIRAVHHFDNGFAASVCCGPVTYGGLDGLYEVGVMWNGVLVQTPDISLVQGWLTEDMVSLILQRIETLPPRTEAAVAALN